MKECAGLYGCKDLDPWYFDGAEPQFVDECEVLGYFVRFGLWEHATGIHEYIVHEFGRYQLAYEKVLWLEADDIRKIIQAVETGKIKFCGSALSPTEGLAALNSALAWVLEEEISVVRVVEYHIHS